MQCFILLETQRTLRIRGTQRVGVLFFSQQEGLRDSSTSPHTRFQEHFFCLFAPPCWAAWQRTSNRNADPHPVTQNLGGRHRPQPTGESGGQPPGRRRARTRSPDLRSCPPFCLPSCSLPVLSCRPDQIISPELKPKRLTFYVSIRNDGGGGAAREALVAASRRGRSAAVPSLVLPWATAASERERGVFSRCSPKERRQK